MRIPYTDDTGATATGMPIVPKWGLIIPFLSGSDGDITQGTWAFNADSNAMLCGYLSNSGAAAINDEIGWNPALAAGTYNFTLAYRKGTSAGQFALRLDGTQIGATIDAYAAAATNNNIAVITAITVATTARHRLSIKVLGKNASSASYWAMIHALQWRQTA